MTDLAAYDDALARLRTGGRLADDALLALCDGDAARADRVSERLRQRGEAEAEGFDLRFAGSLPEPAPDEPEVDLFVSYAHTDDDAYGSVRALVDRVQALQIQRFEPRPPAVFYDRRDIRGFDDWEHRILSKLNEAKAMLIVLSPSYFESDYCRKEWEEFLTRERVLAHSHGAILNLYAVELPGFTFDPEQVQGSWMKDLVRRQWTDVRGVWRLGPAMFEGGDAPPFVEKIRAELTTLVDHAARVLGSKTTVPPPSKYFVGRSADLAAIRKRLASGRVGSLVAAQGLGGMGKSALAFAYAQSFAADYPGGRYLVAAEGRSDLAGAVLSLASDLGVELSPEESGQPEPALKKVHAALTAEGPALIVLDNVSDPKLLEPSQVARALPPTGIHVLATSRLTRGELYLDDAACQEVKGLPNDDALALLNRYRPFDREPDPAATRAAARDIVTWLDGFTLALEVVAVHLWQHREHDVSYPGFRDRLEREGFSRLDRAGSAEGMALSWHTDTRLSTLLAPTLDRLSEAEWVALMFAAVLPPDAVVWPWLRTLIAQVDPGLVPEHVEGAPDPWLTIRDRLHGLRLLTPGDDARISRMHRLTREVVRARMGKAVEGGGTAAHRLMLKRAIHLRDDGWIDRAARWELAPLAEAVTWLALQEDTRAGRLASITSSPYQDLGQLLEARRLMECSVRFGEREFDETSPELAIRYVNLASVLQDLGDLVEARRLLEHAVELGERTFDGDDPALATRYSNLAGVLQAQGDFDQARHLMERAIEIGESAFDADHPDLATAYSNLAVVLHDQGELARARQLFERTVEIEERALDANHPALATTYSNLAGVLRDLGDLAEARQLFERVIEINERSFDSDHPDLAASYSNLAMVALSQGALAEARHLMTRAIEIEEQAFGNDHPSLATSYVNLATVENAQGAFDKAQHLLEQAIEIQERTLGDHPALATTFSTLALVAKAQGDLDKARGLMERAVEIQERAFDGDHPILATSYSTLSVVVLAQGDIGQARRLTERAIDIQERVLGGDHPDLAQSYSNLAMAIAAQEDFAAARPLLERAIAMWDLALGSNHPTLGIGYLNLGQVLWMLGEKDHARKLMQTSYAVFIYHLGAEHPHTQTVWHSLRAAAPSWLEGVAEGRIDPLNHLAQDP